MCAECYESTEGHLILILVWKGIIKLRKAFWKGLVLRTVEYWRTV